MAAFMNSSKEWLMWIRNRLFPATVVGVVEMLNGQHHRIEGAVEKELHFLLHRIALHDSVAGQINTSGSRSRISPLRARALLND